MRLRAKDKDYILMAARSIYGAGVRVYLFGSRTDDSKRGGDIDLLIRTDAREKKGVLARIRLIAKLKHLLGEQKIDVVGDHEESFIVNEALSKGLQLV